MPIVIMLLCGVLMAWGGYSWNIARRYGMPVILSLSVSLLLHSLTGLFLLLAIPLLCLGYGEDAPLTHCFGPSWSRSVWGLLVALTLSVPLLVIGYLSLVWFIAYLALGFTLENALKRLWQPAGDFIIGIGFGAIVLFIHP